MPLDSKILDGAGEGHRAKVTSNQALQVEIVASAPLAIGAPSRRTLLSGKLGTTGLGSGTVDHFLAVGTLANPYRAYISAHADYDQYVTLITFYIEDSAVTHAGFGNLAALTNGFDLVSSERGVETLIIDKSKTFGNLIFQTGMEKPFGADATSFELTNVTGLQDAQVLPYNVTSRLPEGIRIGRGTLDKIELRIHDDMTGLNSFQVIVSGYKVHPS